MHGSQPLFNFTPLEVNNNADTLPSQSQVYAGRHAAQSLITKCVGFTPSSLGIHSDLVNRHDDPIFCKIGCNFSNTAPIKLAPIQCSQLNFDINDEATRLRLRSELPHLTRKQVVEFRLPFYEILCHELLEKGFHYAFTELFILHQKQNEERRVAGPDSPLWLIAPLSEQKEKVKRLAEYLAVAEAASRRRDQHTLYTAYLMLGISFRDSPDDLWIAEHFFKLALVVAGTIPEDEGLKLAVAYQYFGLIRQSDGDLTGAAENLQKFYELTEGRQWADDSGELLHKLAATYLIRNYQLQIDVCNPEYHSQRIALCEQAHNIAMKCNDWTLEAPVRLKMGELLEAAGKLEEAIKFYREYFEHATEMEDHNSLAKVCEALAKLCLAQKKTDESIKYLQRFASICEKHAHWVELGKACQLLGTAYDAIGDHASALKWMKRAYNLPNMIPGLKHSVFKKIAEASRIMIGVSRAHLMNSMYMNTVLNNSSKAVLRIAAWKADPRDEEKHFAGEESKPAVVKIDDYIPKRDVLWYAKNPATGFMYN